VSSGASAAVTAALTAEFTSIPGVDAPNAACRMALRLMSEVEDDDPNREFNAESELISFACSFVRRVVLSRLTVLRR
jgi:hypothetical protein